MNETLQTIHSLRTNHGNFSERAIRDIDMNNILTACIQAANASGKQSYAIIVLDDPQKMRELFGYQGSLALVFCVDYNRIMLTADHLGHQFDNSDVIGFITGSMDTLLAAQTAVIAAKSLGIDSLMTNGLHRNKLDVVYEALDLPETACFPLITVVLGYSQQEPAFQKGRLSLEHVVHFDHYHQPDGEQLEQIVAEYDDHSKHIGLIDNWEELGFQHYLDWFYTKWSAKPARERIPAGKIKEFQERLIQSGFWWPAP